MRVLAESEIERRPGHLKGKSEHGFTVSFPAGGASLGEVVEVVAQDASAYGIAARRVDAVAVPPAG